MAYKIIVLPVAVQDFEEFLRYLYEREKSIGKVVKWADGLRAAVSSLQDFHQRAPKIA